MSKMFSRHDVIIMLVAALMSIVLLNIFASCGDRRGDNVNSSPTPTAASCTYTYSDWGTCQPNNTQTRVVVSATPPGCTGMPLLSQSCTYVPPPGTCIYTYTDWGDCQPNNTQYRTVLSATPPGCTGTPLTFQPCVYVPPPPPPPPPVGVYLSENWDTGTPPTNWPNSCSGTSFHGWEVRDWDCGVGGNGAGLSTTIYHSAPRSFHNVRHAGEYFDAGTIIWNFPTPYPRKIHLRFYLYLPSSGWSNFDPNSQYADEEMTHFLFTNSALSRTGFRINLIDNGSYDTWPPPCIGGMYFGCEIGTRNCPNAIASPDCWNMKNNLDSWHSYEWMWDIPNGLWSHWIDGVQKTSNVPINIAQEQSDFTRLILSGFSSYLRNWQGDFYIDDIVVSSTYIGP